MLLSGTFPYFSTVRVGSHKKQAVMFCLHNLIIPSMLIAELAVGTRLG